MQAWNSLESLIQLSLGGLWLGITCGIASGAWMGLSFHRDDWLGGYGSFPRRLFRLGHIACFGMAFLQLAFAATLALRFPTDQLPLSASVAAASLWIALLTMPAICFLTAWRKPFRHFFPLPVAATAIGIGISLLLCLPI